MTQQYIAGELSALLAELRPTPSESLAHALAELRREIELGPQAQLPRLAREAMTLADLLCWTALDLGDTDGFRRYTSGADMLRQFTDSASLLN